MPLIVLLTSTKVTWNSSPSVYVVSPNTLTLTESNVLASTSLAFTGNIFVSCNLPSCVELKYILPVLKLLAAPVLV